MKSVYWVAVINISNEWTELWVLCSRLVTTATTKTNNNYDIQSIANYNDNFLILNCGELMRNELTFWWSHLLLKRTVDHYTQQKTFSNECDAKKTIDEIWCCSNLNGPVWPLEFL